MNLAACLSDTKKAIIAFLLTIQLPVQSMFFQWDSVAYGKERPQSAQPTTPSLTPSHHSQVKGGCVMAAAPDLVSAAITMIGTCESDLCLTFIKSSP